MREHPRIYTLITVILRGLTTRGTSKKKKKNKKSKKKKKRRRVEGNCGREPKSSTSAFETGKEACRIYF